MINRSYNAATAFFFPFGDLFTGRSSLESNAPPMMILEKSNATGLNDQKANIEAGESDADDENKS